ncbi:MAG TPA: SH3 domain-containing protein, partial [Clostridiales bacterium]|nr:SH3 domain-containing protein [Clostridiales bacterium]
MKRSAALFAALVLLSGLFLSGTAGATPLTIVGEVTVTEHRDVNLRSGDSVDYSIIGVGRPGQLFQTTGKTANGWYEIITPDNQIAYISGKLVYYKPFSTASSVNVAPQQPAYQAPQPQPNPPAAASNTYNYPTNPNRISGINNLPETVEFSYNGDAIAVYSGPGMHYARAANGQARL